MSVSNFLSLFDDLAEFFTLVCCMDIFATVPYTKNYRLKFVVSFLTYICISVIIYILNIYQYGELLLVLLYVAKFAIVILMLYNKKKFQALYVILLIDFLLSLLSSSVSVVVSNLITLENEITYSIVHFFIQMLLLIAALLIRYKTDNNKVRLTIDIVPKHIFLLILFTLSCFGGIGIINKIEATNEVLKQNSLNVYIVILSFLVTSIIISLIFNVISKQRFSNTTAILEKQVEIQLRHYEKLEKMDSEMRRFRHDYVNHMQSLLSLIKMGEYGEAEEYILKLQNTKHKTEALFTTGNKLADAILTDKSDILSDNIRIEYQGVIPSSIENMDLCVILSNSIDNAIEACKECDFPCVISVIAAVKQGYFVITVKNPTINPNNFNDIPPTTKSDKKSHGIGLMNIKDIASKNNGQLSVRCENHLFELSVTLKV